MHSCNMMRSCWALTVILFKNLKLLDILKMSASSSFSAISIVLCLEHKIYLPVCVAFCVCVWKHMDLTCDKWKGRHQQPL